MESYCMHFTVIWFFIHREVFFVFILINPSGSRSSIFVTVAEHYIAGIYPDSFFSLLDGYLDRYEFFFPNNTVLTFLRAFSCTLPSGKAFSIRVPPLNHRTQKIIAMMIFSSSHGWYVTSAILDALNEKLIHFTQWCLRTLGLNSLHKWLKTAGIYLRSGIAAEFVQFQFHLMVPNCSSKWLYQFILTPTM